LDLLFEERGFGWFIGVCDIEGEKIIKGLEKLWS
jgi:hypothetical protein